MTEKTINLLLAALAGDDAPSTREEAQDVQQLLAEFVTNLGDEDRAELEADAESAGHASSTAFLSSLVSATARRKQKAKLN